MALQAWRAIVRLAHVLLSAQGPFRRRSELSPISRCLASPKIRLQVKRLIIGLPVFPIEASRTSQGQFTGDSTSLTQLRTHLQIGWARETVDASCMYLAFVELAVVLLLAEASQRFGDECRTRLPAYIKKLRLLEHVWNTWAGQKRRRLVVRVFGNAQGPFPRRYELSPNWCAFNSPTTS